VQFHVNFLVAQKRSDTQLAFGCWKNVVVQKYICVAFWLISR